MSGSRPAALDLPYAVVDPVLSFWYLTVGVAGVEPTTSSSRSNCGECLTPGRYASHLPRRSTDVRGCLPLFVGVVTQLDTRPFLAASATFPRGNERSGSSGIM
ncbi:hypothetical protein GCM10023086_21250 [Streptomyces venetus]|uniref:Uncharacterized protein n=1 Tax=Streptomyces venetus TaxID=1701086 RepID=A0ABP8FHX3_9ACTN